MLKDLILKNRSYRRFQQERSVPVQTLRELVELARFSPSAANLQPLKFLLVCSPEACARVFPTLAWAGYLQDWDGPAEGERPSAYIVILGDTRIRAHIDCDHGIAAQSIMLGAVERGLGGCMIGSVDRERLRQELDIPAHFEILLVLALGEPVEKVVLDDVEPGGDIRYWRDAFGVHHVPKRPLDELIAGEFC
ncbi:MAG: nitroreductase [Armatimonadota bacterium]|nr:MAG: nitroreductase [Armatimonadota bacterium]